MFEVEFESTLGYSWILLGRSRDFGAFIDLYSVGSRVSMLPHATPFVSLSKIMFEICCK
jgi:hypothetical protein